MVCYRKSSSFEGMTWLKAHKTAEYVIFALKALMNCQK